jgi:glycosyltransferase involved in cell wall biosynthesis
MIDNSAPLVSFVVPCYNYGRYLGDCLDSIFGQEGQHDFEVIAIDDASTDSTQEVLRAYSDPRLRVITHNVNQGHVATINEGLRETRGMFVARIDPDDRYRPYFLNTVLEKFAVFPNISLVYGDAAIIDDRGKITVEGCDHVHKGQDFKGNELVQLLELNFICAPTVIARREAWIRVLPVPEGLAFNDWYFTLMIARQYEFYYVNKVLADYRVHTENHHTKIIRDKSEEQSLFWVLDRIFSTHEGSSDLERQKQRAGRRIYGTHYLTLANKYFGVQMDGDARRCYLRAIGYWPRYGLQPAPLRRLLATFIGRSSYEAVKSVVKVTLRHKRTHEV